MHSAGFWLYVMEHLSVLKSLMVNCNNILIVLLNGKLCRKCCVYNIGDGNARILAICLITSIIQEKIAETKSYIFKT